MNKPRNKYLALDCRPRNKDSASGKRMFESDSQWEAVQLARMHFQIKPKDFNMLSVHLVEKDGKQVVHTADF
jgi:hypothetical protein